MLPYFNIFGFQLPSYGCMMFLGMLLAFFILYRIAPSLELTEDDILSAAIWAIAMGLVGSKLLFWLVRIKKIIADPHFLLETLNVGFVFYGALILGCVGLLICAKRRKQSVLRYFDLIMPPFIAAQGIGRVGCFLAGCCYGVPTDSPLGVVYPVNSGAPSGIPLLPVQLFETVFCLIYACILIRIVRREKRCGTTFGWYCIGYGVWRFIIEFWRDDERGAVGALSTSQFIGIFVVLVGILTLLAVKKGKTELRLSPESADGDSVREDPADANTASPETEEAGKAPAVPEEAPAENGSPSEEKTPEKPAAEA